MTIHTYNLANGELIQQMQPEYRCSSCDEYFTGDLLDEVEVRDPQNGEWQEFYFCHKPKCQERKRRLR